MKRLKWCCRENAAGALYKIITREKLVNVSHMILLNVEISNACRFRVFHCHFSTVSRFPFPRFSVTPVLTRTNRVLEVATFFLNIQNVVTNFSCWPCLYTLLGPISLFISNTRCWNLSLYPSALLTTFPKKFHMKLLASDIIFTKLSTKTFCFDAAVFHLSIKGSTSLVSSTCARGWWCEVQRVQCSSFIALDLSPSTRCSMTNFHRC